MTTAPVEFELTIKGEEVVSKALQDVTKDLGAVEAAEKKVTAASTSVAMAQKSVTSSTATAAQGFSKFGSVMSQANGIMGQMGGEAGRVVSGLSSMTGVISAAAGPIGIFTAAATAMVSGILAIKTASDEAKAHLAQLADSARRNAADLSGSIAVITGARSAQALQRTVEEGKGTAEQQEGLVFMRRQALTRLLAIRQEQTEQLTELTTRDAAMRALESGEATIRRAREELNQAERMFEAARDRTEGNIENQKNAPLDRAGGPSITGRRKAYEDMSEEERDAAYIAGTLTAAELREYTLDQIDEMGRMQGFRGSASGNTEVQVPRDNKAIYPGDIEDKGGETSRDKQLRETIDRAKELGEVASETGARIGQVFGSAFTAALNGQKAFGKAVRDGFRDMLAGLAVSETAKSLSALGEALMASSNPITAASAGPLYASAAKHAAAAAVAGAGAAAIGAAGSGGGGGGSGGGGRPSPSAGMRSGDSGANRNITINMNAPVLTAGTYADVGRTVKQVLQDAENKYGA